MNAEPEFVTDVAKNLVEAVCPACGGRELERFFEIPELPVNGVALCATRESALQCPKAGIELGFCCCCGAVSNLVFDVAQMAYDPSYDNSLYFSPTFREYTDGVARGLLERYNLHSKTVLEIGCGNAEFLSLVCRLGDNRGIGFDPSFIPGRANLSAGRGITIVRDLHSAQYAQYEADFVMCRHVLEHIAQPRSFLRNVRAALGEKSGAAIFFELPDASFIFHNKGIWDIIYEHCFYYSAGALASLFSSCGFDVLNVSKTFDGQYLCLEARLSSEETGLRGNEPVDLDTMKNDIRQFAEEYRSRRTYWAHALSRFARQHKRVALWGAGAKGAMFLNALRSVDSVEYVVDVNPHKRGLYISGSGQKVVGPEFLKEYRPDVVVAMNSIYLGEIRNDLHRLGLDPELMAVSGGIVGA